MKKPISRFMHGIIDYNYATMVPLMPELVGFSEDEKRATAVCRAIGGITFGQSLLTRYELGAYRLLPFKVHLGMDLAVGLVALGAPWLFGFQKNIRARNTLIGVGVQALLVTALIQNKEMPA